MRSQSVTSIHRPNCPAQSDFNGRAMHLIDAENLLGRPNAPADAIQGLWHVCRYGIPVVRVRSQDMLSSRASAHL